MKNLPQYFKEAKNAHMKELALKAIELLEQGEVHSFLKTIFYRTQGSYHEQRDFIEAMGDLLVNNSIPFAKIFLYLYDEAFSDEEKDVILKKCVSYETIKKI